MSAAITTKEIMDIISDVLVDYYRSEYDEIEIRIDRLIKIKELKTDIGGGYQNSGEGKTDGLSGFRG